MRKFEGSSVALRAKHHYREAVSHEATCATCANRWKGGTFSYCESLSGPHGVGTLADSRHTCDLHEEAPAIDEDEECRRREVADCGGECPDSSNAVHF